MDPKYNICTFVISVDLAAEVEGSLPSGVIEGKCCVEISFYLSIRKIK